MINRGAVCDRSATYLVALNFASHRIGALDDALNHRADMLTECHIDVQGMPAAQEPSGDLVASVERQLLLEVELCRVR